MGGKTKVQKVPHPSGTETDHGLSSSQTLILRSAKLQQPSTTVLHSSLLFLYSHGSQTQLRKQWVAETREFGQREEV